MSSLKRKTLLRKLDSFKAPRIIVSDVGQSNENVEYCSTEKLPEEREIPSKHSLQIPKELDDDDSDDDLINVDPEDALLNELLVLKLRAQEIQHDIRQLSFATQHIQSELAEIRALKSNTAYTE